MFSLSLTQCLSDLSSIMKFTVSNVTRLRLLAKDCQYNDTDEMIRDRNVFWTNSAKIRAKPMTEGEKLTLDRTIQIAKNYEYSQE